MISSLQIFKSHCTDPYWNLATEEVLFNSVAPDTCILYLWQNKNTVVIGRNQNPWVECRTELLESENGRLARRLSGGGAVFHDLGNLNFTFLTHEEDYDIVRQLEVIRTAVRQLGINAVFSGRNDLLVEGKKFSGNAFYHAAGRAYHHGTLLINANMEKLGRYLSPSKAKLQAKGVTSVRSRVANLTEFDSTITIDAVKKELCAAFSDIYGLSAETLSMTPTQDRDISERCKFYSSWDWLYGTPLPFSFLCEERFAWGMFQLQLQVKKGIVTDAKVYTDSMDWTISQTIEKCLQNCAFTTYCLCNALTSDDNLSSDISKDICNLLKTQNI